jgi:mycofactocin glycosyltransferase
VSGRPAATVIVPFLGSDEELHDLARRLERLRLSEGDEVLVADNRPGAPPARRLGSARAVPAPGTRSPAHARNAAAALATGDWLVFVDADVTPEPDLLDRYLSVPPAEDVGILAGLLEPFAGRDTLVARYGSARLALDQRHVLKHPRAPWAQTANCAVRRAAFDEVGGFEDTARAAEDADLCWRIQAAGWRLEPRLEARARHRNRETLPALLSQLAVHGAGVAWLERRYPGSYPAPGPRQFAGGIAWRLRNAARAKQRDERLFALIDALAFTARTAGRLRSNRAA